MLFGFSARYGFSAKNTFAEFEMAFLAKNTFAKFEMAFWPEMAFFARNCLLRQFIF